MSAQTFTGRPVISFNIIYIIRNNVLQTGAVAVPDLNAASVLDSPLATYIRLFVDPRSIHALTPSLCLLPALTFDYSRARAHHQSAAPHTQHPKRRVSPLKPIDCCKPNQLNHPGAAARARRLGQVWLTCVHVHGEEFSARDMPLRFC